MTCRFAGSLAVSMLLVAVTLSLALSTIVHAESDEELRIVVAKTATASATVKDGSVVQVTITSGGSGYSSAPQVTITDPNGSGAEAIARISSGPEGGTVLYVTVKNGGSGYTDAPTVTISAPSGSRVYGDTYYVAGAPLAGAVEDVESSSVEEPPAPSAGTEAISPLSSVGNGQPDWVELGPGPGPGGQAVRVSGAVEAIAADPSNPNRVFVAAVNGGIWRTLNATAASPSWFPLTDSLPSLSMGAIAISPLNSNVVFAGFGRFSSGYDGISAYGILRSTDGGTTWSIQASQTFNGMVTRKVVPAAFNDSVSGQQVVLVAAQGSGGGVFRSTDGGSTYARVLAGGASDVAGDPGNAMRFYAGVPGSGIFMSENGGATWVGVNGNLPNPAASHIELSVSGATDSGTGYHPVYAAVFNPPGTRVYRSNNPTTPTWTQLGSELAPNGQSTTHLTILADRTDPRVVFFGLYRGDAIIRWDGSTWTDMNGANTANTYKHVDSRNAVFDANGDLLASDDGGIYRLVNPSNVAGGGTRRWVPVAGNLRAYEFYSVAYDSVNHVFLGAAQDNGCPEESAQDAYLSSLDENGAGDGTVVAADNSSSPGQSLHYAAVQYMPLGPFYRRTFNNANGLVHTDVVPFRVNGTGGKLLYQVDPGHGFSFFTPFVLNSVDPRKMLVSLGGFLYESTSTLAGDDLNPVGGIAPANNDGIDNDGDGTTDEGDEFVPLSPIGYATGWAYGGSYFGTSYPDVLYFGSGNTLRVRTSGSGLPTLATYPGGSIRDIALDPQDWHQAYVVDDSGRVWRTTNAAATAGGWTEITGNLRSLSTDLRTIETVSPATVVPGQAAVVVGGSGGVFFTPDPRNGPSTTWNRIGNNFPHVVVTDMHYDGTDDILLAGTFGRGAWKLYNARLLLQAGRAGALDPTSNSTGKKTTDFGGGAEDSAQAVAIQPDGKIVAAGQAGVNGSSTGRDFGLVRYNADGSIDASFGGGMVRTDFGSAADDVASAVALQSDGKIVAAGWAFVTPIDLPTYYAFAVARYNGDGSLDSSFGSGGKALIKFGAGNVQAARGVAIRPNGKIVVVGQVDNSASGTHYDFAVAQLNANGSLDTSFGSGATGKVTTDYSTGNDSANAVALQSDGKIVAAGFASTLGTLNFAVARYNVDGSLDGTLAPGGVASYDFSGQDDAAFGVAIQPDGKIILGGYARPSAGGNLNFAVLRLNSLGASLDSSFGSAGKAIADFGGSSDEAHAVALQSDGKIILVGSTNCCNFGPTDFGVARFNANGSLDANFGPYGNGEALTSFSGFNNDVANAVALDGDGRIVVVGSAYIPNDLDFAMVRYAPGRYPLRGTPSSVPGVIQAEDYDNGGPNVVYSDTSININEAGDPYRSNYRPCSGADLETDSDGGNNIHLAYVHAGESLYYSLNITATGTYTIQARVASSGNGGTFHVEFDGTDTTGKMTIPNTGGFLSFQTIAKIGVSLSSGQHQMRVVFDSDGSSGFVGNLNYFSIMDTYHTDSDGDGMNDGWELQYGRDPYTAQNGNVDPDGDGETDLQESIAGTNPNDRNSALRILSVTRQVSGNIVLTWNSFVGTQYQVYATTNPSTIPLAPISGIITATGSTTAFTDAAASGTQKFYKVLAVP